MATIDPQPMIAPLFLANSLNWLALGTLLVQLYHYVQNYPKDKAGIRFLVWGLFILELAQTATTTHQAWWYDVTNWNNPQALGTFPWSAMTVPMGAGIIAAIAQIFYAWRIWLLAPTKTFRFIAILIILLALLQSVTSIVTSIIFQVHASPEFLLKLHPEFELWISSSFVVDVIIAGSMLWILYVKKNENMWEHSNNLIARLIVITVGTGTAIALCGALSLALFATTVGASFQYLPGAYIWGKLYSNSVMVSLNARKSQVSPASTVASSSQADSFPMRIQVSRNVVRDGTHSLSGPWGTGSVSDVCDSKDKPFPSEDAPEVRIERPFGAPGGDFTERGGSPV